MKINGIALLVGFFFSALFCHAEKFGTIKNKSIIISKDVDLHGTTKKIPKDYTLKVKGGRIKNGTLIGNQTKLICSEKAFDRVNFKGTWNVPVISTSMFVDLDYENSLKDVLALANDEVQNTITIEKGTYLVSALKNADNCLSVSGNTTLVLNGTIKLKPNIYPRCDIIRVSGNNVKIKGKGSVLGDKHTHLRETGEWGMGIRFHGAVNSSIEGLSIRDCWGDCIYVGGNSKNVLIKNCILDHGRRQGISVTKADGVIIRGCKISNVNGANPEYAIDLEPNPNDTVDHVLIENVEVVNCRGGFQATAGRRNVEKIGKVQIRNCKVSATNKYPIRMKNSEHVSIENCTIKATNEKAAIYSKEIHCLAVMYNTINIEKRVGFTVKNTAKKIVGKNVQQPIETIRVKQQYIRNNRIIEH